MLKVELNKKNENPFYGLRKCVALSEVGGKGNISDTLLTEAWNEVKNDKEQRELFYSLLFSFFDVTARQHNIFGKSKTESGGHSHREVFATVILWMAKNQTDQYHKFLWARLFNEYSCFDSLLACRIKTSGKAKNRKITIIDNISIHFDELAKYIAHIIKSGSDFDKHLVAKFLTRPRLSKRKGHKVMLDATKKTMTIRQNFIKKVSDLVGFTYEIKGKWINFTGFYAWKKEKISNLESVMFSSGRINTMDELGFKTWLNTLPAGARRRVKMKVLTPQGTAKPNREQLAKWYLEFNSFKTDKQKEQRVLEEKVRQGVASEEDKDKLKVVKKEAKVSIGSDSFKTLFMDLVSGKADELKIQPFMDKINLPYNNLVFVDDSMSMNNGSPVIPAHMANFIATICLMKNPDDTGRSLIGLFSNTVRMFSSIDGLAHKKNVILNTTSYNVVKPLIDPTATFKENYNNIAGFINKHRTRQNTNISSIPDDINKWANGDSAKIEQLMHFPVWTLITDGNFNNMYSPESSLNDFMNKCLRYFGYKPFVIAIDVSSQTESKKDRFSGIENFMLVPPNPAAIESLLTNFKDMEIMDIYTELLSIHRSNRYTLVRANVL